MDWAWLLEAIDKDKNPDAEVLVTGVVVVFVILCLLLRFCLQGLCAAGCSKKAWDAWREKNSKEAAAKKREAEIGPYVKAVMVEGRRVPVEMLRERKDQVLAYMFWLIGGFVGIHHFYLERWVHGLLVMWTLNFFGAGMLSDFWFMPAYVNGANSGISAASRKGRGGVCGWLLFVIAVPSVVAAALAVDVMALKELPQVLRWAGVADMEKLAANTTVNPFDVLKVPRDAELSAVSAKLAALRRAEPKPCNAVCKARLEDFRRAHAFITCEFDGKVARRGHPRFRLELMRAAYMWWRSAEEVFRAIEAWKERTTAGDDDDEEGMGSPAKAADEL